MGIIVLLIIGAFVWWMFSGNSSEPAHIKQQQKKADKEFEEMFFSGASGDDIDDF